MHRFFVSPEQIAGGLVRFRPDQAHQIGRVLRLRSGDRVLALDGAGQVYETVLEQVEPPAAVGRISRVEPATGEPRAFLTLYQSLLKRDKFEWVLQKGTEIGVSRFVPVITRRTLARDAAAVSPEKHERWQRIITEAAEQSGRGRLPELAAPQSMGEALAQATAADQRVLIAWEAPGQDTLATALAGLPAGVRVALFVGPEGGYDDEEVALARAQGAAPVTFGPRILRTETAALIGPALILHHLGDMG